MSAGMTPERLDEIEKRVYWSVGNFGKFAWQCKEEFIPELISEIKRLKLILSEREKADAKKAKAGQG